MEQSLTISGQVGICLDRDHYRSQQVAGGNECDIYNCSFNDLRSSPGPYMPSHGHAICLKSFNHD